MHHKSFDSSQKPTLNLPPIENDRNVIQEKLISVNISNQDNDISPPFVNNVQIKEGGE